MVICIFGMVSLNWAQDLKRAGKHINGILKQFYIHVHISEGAFLALFSSHKIYAMRSQDLSSFITCILFLSSYRELCVSIL